MTRDTSFLASSEADQDPRIARSRSRLLAAATDLLVEGGASAVTVDAVAERSGVAKSTMYRHWASRTDLLFDVMRFAMPIAVAPDAAFGFADALRRLLRDLAESLSGPRWASVMPALLGLQHHSPELAALVMADREARVAVLGDVLERGRAEGWFRTMPDLARTAQILAGPLIFAVVTGDDRDLVALADEVADLYLAALRPANGAAVSGDRSVSR